MNIRTNLIASLALALLCTASPAAWAQFNTPPTAVAGPDFTVTAGSFVTLDGSLSNDPEGDPITYSWVQLVGDPVTLSDATLSMPTFTAPATAQTLTFKLTVTDVPWGDSTSDQVNVFVTAVPEPAAAWMFGSGILTLLGVARLRKQSVRLLARREAS